MSSINIQALYPFYTDLQGNSLDSGYLYFGVAGLNAQTNPITVYWDSGLTIPASQPIRTINGYPSRTGTASKLYTSSDCSVVVRDNNGNLVTSESSTIVKFGLENINEVFPITLGTVFDLVTYGAGVFDGQQAIVSTYHFGLSGGGGTYVWRSSGNKADHNGGTIIDPDVTYPSDWSILTERTAWYTASTGSGTWELEENSTINSETFGSKTDFIGGAGTDNYQSLNAYKNYCVANKIGEMVIASGGTTMYSSGTLTIDTGVYTQPLSVVSDGGELYQMGAGLDAIDLSTTQVLKNSYFRDVKIRSLSGHVINIPYGITGFKIDNCDMTAESTGKSIIYSNLPTVGIYDCIFENGDWYLASGATVPGVDVTVSGTLCNENDFRNLRVYNSGVSQFFSIQNTNLTTYLVNNKFSNINYEVCSGGGILLTNAKNNTIENQSFWDTTLYTNHLVYFKTNTGYESESNTIANVTRNGDALDTGIHDIFLEYAQDTFIFSSFTPNSDGPSYDLNGKRGVIIGLYYNVVNDQNFQQIGTVDQVLTSVTTNTAKEIYKSGGTLTISAGVVTATSSNHLIDTEAAAATDDLSTINGGTDGQILRIRAANDTRDVVVKNAIGNIRLNGALDFTLDRAYDQLTLMYDSPLASWVEVSRMEYP